MKFLAITLIVHRPDPLTGIQKSTEDRLSAKHSTTPFGHTVLHPHAEAGGLTEHQHRASLELFQSKIAPVLRREIPDPPFAWGPVLPASPLTQESVHV